MIGRRWSDFEQYVALIYIFGIPKKRQFLIGLFEILQLISRETRPTGF